MIKILSVFFLLTCSSYASLNNDFVFNSPPRFYTQTPPLAKHESPSIWVKEAEAWEEKGLDLMAIPLLNRVIENKLSDLDDLVKSAMAFNRFHKPVLEKRAWERIMNHPFISAQVNDKHLLEAAAAFNRLGENSLAKQALEKILEYQDPLDIEFSFDAEFEGIDDSSGRIKSLIRAADFFQKLKEDKLAIKTWSKITDHPTIDIDDLFKAKKAFRALGCINLELDSLEKVVRHHLVTLDHLSLVDDQLDRLLQRIEKKEHSLKKQSTVTKTEQVKALLKKLPTQATAKEIEDSLEKIKASGHAEESVDKKLEEILAIKHSSEILKTYAKDKMKNLTLIAFLSNPPLSTEPASMH